MLSKMATLLHVTSTDQNLAELEMARLWRNGLKLRLQRIEKSFGNWYTAWIPKVLHALSVNSASTPTGNLRLTLPLISSQPELNLLGRMWMDDMIGYNSLESDLLNHS